MNYVDSASDDDVWERFIANNQLALEACKESKITKPDDLHWLFEQISYAGMRSTFPSKSHGRTIIGPRIVPMKNLIKLPNEEINKHNNLTDDYAGVSDNRKKDKNLVSGGLLGKRVRHKSFGEGTIIGTKKYNQIIIQFDDIGEKTVVYDFCLEKNYLIFI